MSPERRRPVWVDDADSLDDESLLVASLEAASEGVDVQTWMEERQVDRPSQPSTHKQGIMRRFWEAVIHPTGSDEFNL